MQDAAYHAPRARPSRGCPCRASSGPIVGPVTDRPVADLSDDEIRERYQHLTLSELEAMDEDDARRVVDVVHPELKTQLASLGRVFRDRQTTAFESAVAATKGSGVFAAHSAAVRASAQALEAALKARRGTSLAGDAAASHRQLQMPPMPPIPPRPEIMLLRQSVETQGAMQSALEDLALAQHAAAQAQQQESVLAERRHRMGQRATRATLLAAVEAVAAAVVSLDDDTDLTSPQSAVAVAVAVLSVGACFVPWPEIWHRLRPTRPTP